MDAKTMERISVTVHVADPISRIGVVSELQKHQELDVLRSADPRPER
jgi:hypothetical protein